MKLITQLNLKIALMLSLVFVFTSCQKPQERPAKVDPKIAKDIAPLSKITDVTGLTSDSNFSVSDNIKLMSTAISYADQKDQSRLTKLLDDEQMSFILLKDKIILLQIVKSSADQNLLTEVSLAAWKKDGQLTESIQKTDAETTRFKVVFEIKIKYGKLNHDRTDYGEKKPILIFEETTRDDATHIQFVNEDKKEESKK